MLPDNVKESEMIVNPMPQPSFYNERLSTLQGPDSHLFLEKKLNEIIHYEVEPGIKYSKPIKGFYSPAVEKILTYSPGEVRSLLAPFTSPENTTCNSFTIWMNHFSFLIYAILLMIMAAYTGFPDGDFGKGNPCTMGPKKNFNMCKLDTLLMESKLEFRFLIAFILAGYVAAAIHKWNSRRKTYASLCGNCRNLMTLHCAYIPGTPKYAHVRRTANRFSLLALELAVLKGRGVMDTEQAREHLVNNKLLEPDEWSLLINGDRHTTVFWWLHALVKRLSDEGVYAPWESEQLAKAISQYRGNANDLMDSLHKDLPFSYSALCGLLVKINVAIFTTWKAVQWSIWLRAAGWGNPMGILVQTRFYIDVVFLLAWNMSYMALYDLGYMLHNPFLNRRIDIAHEFIFNGLWNLGGGLACVDEHMHPMSKGTTDTQKKQPPMPQRWVPPPAPNNYNRFQGNR